MAESDYYSTLRNWLRTTKGLDPEPKPYRFDDLDLLTGDVVGKSGDQVVFACEVKVLPYPVVTVRPRTPLRDSRSYAS